MREKRNKSSCLKIQAKLVCVLIFWFTSFPC